MPKKLRRKAPQWHGEAVQGQFTPEYKVWRDIKRRCLNPNVWNYSRYGGRGITIAPEWRDDYLAFLRDVGRRPSPIHSIERIDNDGDYEPGNVRWATRKEQARNRRSSRRLTFRGETRTMTEWAELLGLSVWALSKRLNAHGWSVEDALTKPVKRMDRSGLCIDGEVKSFEAWARVSPVTVAAIRQRLKKGWDPKRAVFTNACVRLIDLDAIE